MTTSFVGAEKKYQAAMPFLPDTQLHKVIIDYTNKYRRFELALMIIAAANNKPYPSNPSDHDHEYVIINEPDPLSVSKSQLQEDAVNADIDRLKQSVSGLRRSVLRNSVDVKSDDDLDEDIEAEETDDFDENDGPPDEVEEDNIPSPEPPDYSNSLSRAQQSSLTDHHSNSSHVSFRDHDNVNGDDHNKPTPISLGISTSHSLQQQCSRNSNQKQLSPFPYSAPQSPRNEQLLRIRGLKSENSVLKERLHEAVRGKGIESTFINEEDFANHKLGPFRQQTHPNLHQELIDILSERYDDDDDDDGDDEEGSDMDLDDDEDSELETTTKFELLLDRIACNWLIDIMKECYQSMMARKERICQIIVNQLEIEESGSLSAGDIAFKLIHTQLQNRWNHYLNHKMKNMYGVKVDEMKEEINGIMNSEKVNGLGVTEDKAMRKKVEMYIEKCCELSWIMILSIPQMKWLICDGDYEERDGHDLWTGSKVQCDAARIVFCAFPAVAQVHFSIADKEIVISKGEVFAHHDKELIAYVLSDANYEFFG